MWSPFKIRKKNAANVEAMFGLENVSLSSKNKVEKIQKTYRTIKGTIKSGKQIYID